MKIIFIHILQAGIRKIILALEPECAALYCGTLLQGLRDTLKNQALRIVGPGSRYILLDMGGSSFMLAFLFPVFIKKVSLVFGKFMSVCLLVPKY